MSVQEVQVLIKFGKTKLSELKQRVADHKQKLVLIDSETSDDGDMAVKSELQNLEEELVSMLNNEVDKVEAFVHSLESGQGLRCPCCGNEVSVERMRTVFSNICTWCTEKKSKKRH